MSRREKAVSLIGGMLAIIVVIAICRDALGLSGAAALIASMGATTVLLFGVPHGSFSQPWPVLGGHLCSAIIGVACARWIGHGEVAAAAAVGLAILVMHQLRCIHPPGGATALVAVIGGPAVYALGWSFVWHPVMVNALVLVAIAVAFNAPFPWRRYPSALVRPATPVPAGAREISHEQVVDALREIDSLVDITEDDLIRLVQILGRADPVT